jgi:hypothetical protein
VYSEGTLATCPPETLQTSPRGTLWIMPPQHPIPTGASYT